MQYSAAIDKIMGAILVIKLLSDDIDSLMVVWRCDFPLLFSCISSILSCGSVMNLFSIASISILADFKTLSDLYL